MISQHNHAHLQSSASVVSLRSTCEKSEGLEEQERMFEDHGISIAYLPCSQRLKATAGTILKRCSTKVECFRNRMGRTVCIFKIGLSSNPLIRFEDYKERNYSEMSLLHVTQNMGEAQMLEAALIAQNIGEKGCRNEKLGGDGPNHLSPQSFYFVYVAGAQADSLKAIR